MGRWAVKVTIATAALAASVAPAANASAKPVPCTKLSNGEYKCSFYTRAPVRDPNNKRVGYLSPGRRVIDCQALGRTVHSHGYYNRWWARAQANDGTMGWVNAVWARGGSNNGKFQGVRVCDPSIGSPPTSTTRSPAPAPTPMPLPCHAIGAHKYQCFFYTPGDGIHNGTPVRRGAKRVGYLNYGNNWVVCQQRGGRRTIGNGITNVWWAWTKADNHTWGWVNAVWARGGSNNGKFAGVPRCGSAYGTPPRVPGATGGPVRIR